MDFEQEKAETRGAHGKGAAPRSAFGSTLLRIRREVASISGRKVQDPAHPACIQKSFKKIFKEKKRESG